MLTEYVKGSKTLSIAGMCKNAGKTTVLNALIRELHAEGEPLGLTSIGRDGEAVDIVTGTDKPSIYVPEGTVIATAAGLITSCDITRETLFSTGIPTPMGEVMLLRARSDGNVQLAGPSITTQLVRTGEDMRSFGAKTVIFDGAISRKTLASPDVSSTVLLCSGASYHRDMNVTVADTVHAARLLTLPKSECFTEEYARMTAYIGGEYKKVASPTLADAFRSKEYGAAEDIFVPGALTDSMLKPMLMGGVAGKRITAADGSKLMITRDTMEKLDNRGIRLYVLKPVTVALITVNPFSAYGYDYDGDAFLAAMSESIGLPVIDVNM